MSFTMMAKAKPIKTGNSGRKLVLMMLADIADDTGRCFPSYQHVADVCEMSRRSVITHISKLEEAGFLNVTHRKSKGEMLNSSNVYQLTLNSAVKEEEKSGENFAPPSETVALPSENSALGGSENSAPITYHSSEPINEPIKTKQKKVITKSIELPEWLDHNLFNDYQIMRKSIKAPMTSRATSILINKLSELAAAGHNPNELLETAILNNWKSVFAPKGDFNHGTSQRQPTRQTSSDRMRAAANQLVSTLSQPHSAHG